MSAYKQAEKDMIALNTPELHHNKGIVSDIPFLHTQGCWNQGAGGQLPPILLIKFHQNSFKIGVFT